jgi:sarcosine oxidase
VIDRSQSLSARREHYALPGPGIGLKTGIHRSGTVADPDSEGAPDERVVEAAGAWVRERYRLAQADPVLVETCLYTSTEDERFIFERLGPVVVCSACSGHGFKFVPEVGRRAAALAEEALAS